VVARTTEYVATAKFIISMFEYYLAVLIWS